MSKFRSALFLKFGSSNSSSADSAVSQLQMDRQQLELLELASEMEAKAAPRPIGEVIVVQVYTMITKIRNLDAKASSVNGSFTVHLMWQCPPCKGKRVPDENMLWRPNLTVLNRDRIVETHEGPHFYPNTGEVRMAISYDGSFGNEVSDSQSFLLLLVFVVTVFCCSIVGGSQNSQNLPSKRQRSPFLILLYNNNVNNNH
jgi:hypothetical protein